MSRGLQKAGRARRWRRAALAFAGLVLALAALDRLFPLPPGLSAGPVAGDASFVVLAEDGTPLRSWPSADGALRRPVPLEAVSPRYLQALLRYEDRWFYRHPGVNSWALARAGWQWLRHGRIVSGGSTLTMQLARIVDPPPPGSARRSVGAKLRQLARALQLELHFSKREILTLYLARAPMGGQVEGVEMASRSYLNKGAAELSFAEAALLVALPQSPSRLRPDRAPGLARAARDKVLSRMTSEGVWDAAAVAEAKQELVFAPPLRARWLAPLAAERLRVAAGFDARRPEAIRSTLDAGLQTRLERVLLDRLAGLPEHVSVAALVVENDTLAVRGYAGSADFSDERRASQVDMVRAVRSPGSTLKPFLYAMALDEGLVHSESLLIDAPQNFGGYAPGNFQASFSGPVSVSEALQRSLNVPAVDLLDRLGPDRFVAQLRHAGLRLRLSDGAAPNLSVILGGAGTTLEELVGAYASLARRGIAGRPRLTPDAPRVETRLMSAGAAFIVREILENGGRPGAPFNESPRRIAWKTGTSFGFRDAWAIGVTDRYTLGVWIGRPDGTPNPGYFGANTAAPLVRDLAAAIGPTQLGARSVPDDVRTVEICWPLGLAADSTAADQCRVRRSAWTLAGVTPPTLPDRLRIGGLIDSTWIAPARAERVRPDCAGAGGAARQVSFVRWPTLLQPWVDADWLSPVERLPWSAGCLAESPRRGLRIAGLDAHTALQAAPGRTAIAVEVRAIGTREPVQWLLDGRWLGATAAAAPTLRLSIAEAGEHALTALDTQGRFDRLVFSVR